jgi:hypothetical protein
MTVIETVFVGLDRGELASTRYIENSVATGGVIFDWLKLESVWSCRALERIPCKAETDRNENCVTIHPSL